MNRLDVLAEVLQLSCVVELRTVNSSAKAEIWRAGSGSWHRSTLATSGRAVGRERFCKGPMRNGSVSLKICYKSHSCYQGFISPILKDYRSDDGDARTIVLTKSTAEDGERHQPLSQPTCWTSEVQKPGWRTLRILRSIESLQHHRELYCRILNDKFFEKQTNR